MLDHQVWTTGQLPFPLSGASPSTHYLQQINTEEFAPDDRLILYLDYYLGDFPIQQQFEFFLISLNDSGCTLNAVIDLADSVPLQGPLLDKSRGQPADIHTAPLGGDGELPSDRGINAWDITEITPFDPDCADTVASVTDYTGTEVPYAIFWHYEGFGALIRAVRLYRGQLRTTCQSQSTTHTQSPTSPRAG